MIKTLPQLKCIIHRVENMMHSLLGKENDAQKRGKDALKQMINHDKEAPQLQCIWPRVKNMMHYTAQQIRQKNQWNDALKQMINCDKEAPPTEMYLTEGEKHVALLAAKHRQALKGRCHCKIFKLLKNWKIRM